MFFPSSLPAGGLKFANMAASRQSPLGSLRVVKLEGSPALH